MDEDCMALDDKFDMNFDPTFKAEYETYEPQTTFDDLVEENGIQVRGNDFVINSNNKRARPAEFDEEIGVDDVEELAPFTVRQRFNEQDIPVYSNYFSSFPGYQRNVCQQEREFSAKAIYEKDKKLIRKERDREEIRQIMRINKMEKKRSLKEEWRIDQIANSVFGSKCFVVGKK
jgi:hypothetical protein